MDHITKNIAKNASVLLGTQVLMWLLTMALTIVLPRYLGAVGVGKLHFASSLWMMIGVITAFGTDLLLTKEIARQPERTSTLFGSAIVLRLGFFVVGYGITIGALHFYGYPADTIKIVCLVGIATLIRQFVAVAQAILQGLERMELFSVGEILSNALYTTLGILFLLNGWSIYAITGLMIVAAGVNLAIHLFFLNRLYPLRLVVDQQRISHLVRAGWPYLLSSFFLSCFNKVLHFHSSFVLLTGTFCTVIFRSYLFCMTTRQSYSSNNDKSNKGINEFISLSNNSSYRQWQIP